MNKLERIHNHQISGPKIIKLTGRVKSVAITCKENSANTLLIGWNENASTKDSLNQGESYSVTPDTGNYLDGNEIRFAFATTNPLVGATNEALVKISYETDQEPKC